MGRGRSRSVESLLPREINLARQRLAAAAAGIWERETRKDGSERGKTQVRGRRGASERL